MKKVNATFCNAHQVINGYSIVGKSLGDVWGEDTFRNVILRAMLTSVSQEKL